MLLFAAVCLGGVLLPARAAFAHVELASSDPANGAIVSGPVAEITLDFSVAASPAGEGIVLYDANATPVAATAEMVTETKARIVPDEPLGAGTWAVSWTMKAPDAHPRSGGVEFVVSAPAAPAPDGESSASPEGSPPTTSAAAPSILDEVVPSSSPVGGWLSSLARAVSLFGALLGIGTLIFAVLVFEGSEQEARTLGFWVRRAGAAVVLAVPLEILGQALTLSGGSLLEALAPSTLLDAVAGAFGVAVTFRLVGGIALFAGTRLETTGPSPHASPLPLVPSAPPPGPEARAVATMMRERFQVASSPGALAGSLIIAASFLFDGHTATTEPAALVRFASLVHVVAAATWVAGVALLAKLLIGRHRRGRPLETARLVIPFSRVAGATVALVGLAGTVLALSIADGIGTFFTTPWGWAMLAKLALAGTAGAIGAYNHLVVVPLLREQPDNGLATSAIRSTIRVEAALLAGVVAVTAVFVGLSAA